MIYYFILLLVVLVIFYLVTRDKKETKNICRGKLSDREYLEHMIPHHQVAIDMSYLLIPNTKNPTMKHLCRNIR